MITDRVRRMCEIVEQTVLGYEPFFDVRLLAFPEFAHMPPIYDTVKGLHWHLAVPVPNEHTERYGQMCRKHGCYLQTGTVLEADPGPGEKVVAAPIDLRALRTERVRRFGHDMRAHLRSELHTYLGRPHLAPAASALQPLTEESIRARILAAKSSALRPPILGL